MDTAAIRWVGGEEFLATVPSGHAVVFDADRKHNSAAGPMEMLLAALGACTSVDVVLILAKNGSIWPDLKYRFPECEQPNLPPSGLR